MATSLFSDQDMMNDVLSTQKFITGGYNTNATEASNPSVKSTLLSILNDEQSLQHGIFVEMQNRGWYQTEPAQTDKINQAKNKFCADCKF